MSIFHPFVYPEYRAPIPVVKKEQPVEVPKPLPDPPKEMPKKTKEAEKEKQEPDHIEYKVPLHLVTFNSAKNSEEKTLDESKQRPSKDAQQDSLILQVAPTIEDSKKPKTDPPSSKQQTNNVTFNISEEEEKQRL